MARRSGGERRPRLDAPGLPPRHGTVLAGGARVVRSGDSHGGFQGEGEFYLVFRVDGATIRRWLSGAAPGGGGWLRGPVPGKVGFHTTFGYEPTGFRMPGSSYTGRGELVRLLGSGEIWYAAWGRGHDSMPWHNGDLLIVDPRTRLVWFSVWDW